MMRRRVAVTGLGVVSPVGMCAKSAWEAVLGGRSGVRALDLSEGKVELPCKVGAVVEAEELKRVVKERGAVDNERAQEPRFISMALCAAVEAMRDAGMEQRLSDGAQDPTRAGVAIGTGIGSSVDEVAAADRLIRERGVRRLSPYFVPRLLVNLAAGHASIRFGLQGPNHCASTACATGAHAIGDASRLIASGDADVMLAGGTESSMNALSFAGFSRLKALSTGFNGSPEQASRPFDKDRDGFVMGEGAGLVVLEELEQAKARGAHIYAEVKGYGMAGDAFHLTAPSEDGMGAQRCMEAALRNAGLEPAHIDYINAHATSTPLGDAVEAEALARIFSVNRPAVSSTKGNTGHLLGAAGAVEAIFAILSVASDAVPPTANLGEVDMDESVQEALHFVRGEAQQRPVRNALSNSFGFGGTNASLIFGDP